MSISDRFICNEFIGHVNRYTLPVEIPEGSLDITQYRMRRREEYFHAFQHKLLPAFNHKTCNTITQTMDGRYWLHFDSDEAAVLFKLTHL